MREDQELSTCVYTQTFNQHPHFLDSYTSEIEALINNAQSRKQTNKMSLDGKAHYTKFKWLVRGEKCGENGMT